MESPNREYETQAVPHYKISLNADDDKSESSYKQNFESF